MTTADLQLCEMACFWINVGSSLAGLIVYIVGATTVNSIEKSATEALLALGWTLGCVGHIFGMLGNLVVSRRRRFNAPAGGGGEEFEMT